MRGSTCSLTERRTDLWQISSSWEQVRRACRQRSTQGVREWTRSFMRARCTAARSSTRPRSRIIPRSRRYPDSILHRTSITRQLTLAQFLSLTVLRLSRKLIPALKSLLIRARKIPQKQLSSRSAHPTVTWALQGKKSSSAKAFPIARHATARSIRAGLLQSTAAEIPQ